MATKPFNVLWSESVVFVDFDREHAVLGLIYILDAGGCNVEADINPTARKELCEGVYLLYEP